MDSRNASSWPFNGSSHKVRKTEIFDVYKGFNGLTKRTWISRKLFFSFGKARVGDFSNNEKRLVCQGHSERYIQ